MVELLLPKQKVAGSSPVSRFLIGWRGTSSRGGQASGKGAVCNPPKAGKSAPLGSIVGKMVDYKHFVYVLVSEKDGKNYTGRTNCLERRLNQHNEGLVNSTRNRRPVVLVYKEEFYNKEQAISREKFLKSGQGRSFLKMKLDGAVPKW